MANEILPSDWFGASYAYDSGTNLITIDATELSLTDANCSATTGDARAIIHGLLAYINSQFDPATDGPVYIVQTKSATRIIPLPLEEVTGLISEV